MIMAIIVLVITATILTLSLSLTATTTKTTTDIYLYEQAKLYAKAATERALLYIAKNGCTDNYFITLGEATEVQFDANITMKYIYTDNVSGCASFTSTPITTPEQNGSVMMETTVTLHDPTLSTEPIRYFRRTLQKL